MQNKERRYLWFILMLTCILCVTRNIPTMASEGEIVQEINMTKDIISVDTVSSQDGTTISAEAVSSQDETTISADVVSGQNETMISENGLSIESSVSEGKLPMDSISSDYLMISENRIDTKDKSVEEKKAKRAFDIVLPTDIPFNIILVGKEGLEGIVASDQFCVENRGYEDVKIIFRGICSGINEEDYVVGNNFVENGIVKGKKNAWIFLEWKDEEGRILEMPKIVMGETYAPGEGEIILKAPKRDEVGKIIGKNDGSKVYFSFVGNLKSDLDEAWKSGELKLDLDYSINVMDYMDNEESKKVESDWEDSNETLSIDQVEEISDNENGTNVNEKVISVSNNEG